LSIRIRLLLLVLVVWLPAVAGFALLARATYIRETEGAQQHVQQLAQSLSSLVEQELDKRAAMARSLGASTALKTRDLSAFYNEASLAVDGTHSWVVLEDAKTQLFTTRAPFQSGAATARAPDAPFVSAPTVALISRGIVSNLPRLAVLAPELSVSPAQYDIGICFEPAVVQALLDHTMFPVGTIAGIVDPNFLVMARTRDAAKWLGKPSAAGLLRRMQTHSYGFAQSTTLDGIPSLVYLASPNRYGWMTAIAIPMSSFSTAAWRVTAEAFAASGALLVIGLAWALYAARRISGPVLALRAAALELSLDIVPPELVTGVEEADAVSAALHQAGLRAKEATATLERRVTEAVNESREAQARLLNGQKLEAIGRLTGGIAHDFNNLLQTISVGLQVMEITATAGQRKVLESSRRATTKAAELVRQMLAFGKAAPLVPAAVDFADFMLKTQELASKALGAKIALVASVDPQLPAVYVDATQLELALLNLVFNARDAMPEGGNIEITAKVATKAQTGSLGDSEFVRIDVADDGPGMDAKTLSRALEPYFTTKAVGAGSGLGLPQVDSFAKLSGGEVRVQSAPGKGTRVSLFLPSCKLPNAMAVSVETHQVQRKLSILMVEDDLLVSSVVVPALESAGHEVTLCGTADDAVLVLERGTPFDVLFTDVVMPGKMTGMDLARWRDANIPALGVVVATGYTSQASETAAEVLRKPYDMATLLTALHRAVGSPRAMPA
jgi:signal transduction histidine kinase/ActR/RegA family two-component response regulator